MRRIIQLLCNFTEKTVGIFANKTFSGGIHPAAHKQQSAAVPIEPCPTPPVVIIPVHKSFGFFVNRSWIYTAISRAKDICITVGQFEAIAQAIGRQDAVVRKTMLKEKLQEVALEKELEAI